MAETFGGHSETLTIQKAPDRKEVAGDSFSPQKIEQRRLQSQINNLKEAQEDKKEILEDLLMNYPDEDFFYYEDGELMPFSEYIGEEGSDFVHIKTRESLITKISAINESLSETRIEKEIKRLDDLIMGTHKNNPNIRLILMEMRSQLSGYGKIDGYDFYGEELQDMLFFLEKNDTENLTSADYVQGVYNTFNFCRKHLAVDAKMVLAGIKDLTSSQIYQYGDGKNDEAPFEAWLEESIIDNNYIPDFAEPAVLETGRVAAGTVAGGIDGVLDYFGAVVDLNLVPDEVIRSLMDLVPTILREYKQIFDEILDGIDGPAEVGYILGYVVGLLAGAHFFPAGVVWGGPLKMVMGKIKTLNISEKAFEKFKSNIVLIRNTAEDKFGKYAPELEAFQD
ncbi:MAG: hypothetical protein N4A38_00005, partial [Candidatus Gracilibacteria bacterium]|nr:hypothetical protein [Candidatus Gracilibacteria bacterium]